MTVNGRPLSAVKMVLSCQPLPRYLPAWGMVGKEYKPPTLKFRRTSWSQSPRALAIFSGFCSWG